MGANRHLPPTSLTLNMYRLSEDILILIFRNYLEEPSTMPVLLTMVCRRWYNIAYNTPVLCSRVVITAMSNDHLALIGSSCGLKTYLSYTDGPDIHVPLDIELRCIQSYSAEHKAMCGRRYREEERCTGTTCHFTDQRKELLDTVLTLLAGLEASPSSYPSDFQTLNTLHPIATLEMSSQPRKLRLHRWRSLLLDWGGLTQDSSDHPNEYWIQNSFISAPALTRIILRNVPERYQPPGGFAPNLCYLALHDFENSWQPPFRLINSPNLKTLYLKSDEHIPWSRLTGVCHAEELTIVETRPVVATAISIEFPNLRKLSISPAFHRRLLTAITRQFRHTGRRLEEVHLVNYTPWWMNFASLNTLFINSRKLVVEFSPEQYQILVTGSAGWEGDRSDIRKCLQKLISACAADTEVIGVDEVHEKVLAEARADIQQGRSGVFA